MRWTECDLLNFGEVVAWIAIQHQFADLDQWELTVRPDLGQIKWIKLPLLGLLEGHHLDVHRPRGEVTLGNVVVQIPNRIVRILSFQLLRTSGWQILDTLICLVVELTIDRFTLGVHQFEGVRAVAVHLTIAVRGATITKQEHDLMRGFGAQSDEIPKHISIFEMSCWITLLGMNEAGEQRWVTDEEDWRVVANQIPNAVLSVELDSKTAWITCSIGRATLATNS